MNDRLERPEPPAKDPAIRKGPVEEPTNEKPRRDPTPKGPDGEEKRIEDPKPTPETPDTVKV